MHCDARTLDWRMAVLWCSAVLFMAVLPARAADSTKSSDPGIPLAAGPKKTCNVDAEWSIEELVSLYHEGKWDDVQKKLRDVITPCVCPGQPTLQGSFSVAFVDRSGPAPTLIRVAVRENPPDYSARFIDLPLSDAYLWSDLSESLTTTYSATRSQDPLVAALPKFFGLFDKQLLTAGSVYAFDGGRPAKPAKKLTVNRINVPDDLRRSQITFSDSFSQADLGLGHQVDQLKDKLDKEIKATCAKDVNATLHDIVVACSGKEKCPDLETLKASFLVKSSACNGDFEKRDAQGVFVEYAKLTMRKPDLTATTTYSLAPLTHVTLGVGVAAIAKTGLNQRVKIDSGKIAADSPTGAATIALVNYHPAGFDDSTTDMTLAERVHLVGGVVITPDPGLYAGVGFGIIRGLSVHGGYGILLSKVLRSDDRIGEAPTNPEKPSKRGALGVVLAGLEYAFNP